MNRPKKENFTKKVFDGNFETMYVFDSESYERALNDYIDQLEKQLSKDDLKICNPNKFTKEELFEYLQKEQLKNKRLKRKVKRYKRIVKKKDRALDKACGELECYDNHMFGVLPVTKEQWKEWCLKNE